MRHTDDLPAPFDLNATSMPLKVPNPLHKQRIRHRNLLTRFVDMSLPSHLLCSVSRQGQDGAPARLLLMPRSASSKQARSTRRIPTKNNYRITTSQSDAPLVLLKVSLVSGAPVAGALGLGAFAVAENRLISNHPLVTWVSYRWDTIGAHDALLFLAATDTLWRAGWIEIYYRSSWHLHLVVLFKTNVPLPVVFSEFA